MVTKIVVLVVFFCLSLPSVVMAQQSQNPPEENFRVVFREARPVMTVREAVAKAKARLTKPEPSKKPTVSADENINAPPGLSSIPTSSIITLPTSSVFELGQAPPVSTLPARWQAAVIWDFIPYALPTVAIGGLLRWWRLQRRYAPRKKDMRACIAVYDEKLKELWSDPERVVTSRPYFNFRRDTFVLASEERYGGMPGDAHRKDELWQDLQCIADENPQLLYRPSEIGYDRNRVYITFVRKGAQQ
jgi:hypothetical protein